MCSEDKKRERRIKTIEDGLFGGKSAENRRKAVEARRKQEAAARKKRKKG